MEELHHNGTTDSEKIFASCVDGAFPDVYISFHRQRTPQHILDKSRNIPTAARRARHAIAKPSREKEPLGFLVLVWRSVVAAWRFA